MIREYLSNIKSRVLLSKRYRNWISIVKSGILKEVTKNVILRNGIKFNAPEDGDLLALVSEICFRKCYTPEYLGIEKNDLVVDIGANIGVFAIFSASKTKNKVYALEPLAENCKFIDLNAKNNQLTNVEVKQVAVSDRIGKGMLYLTKSKGGNLLFNHNINGKLGKCIEVPTTTLKRVMEEFNLEHIDFLKMDCEGAEGQIFESTPLNYLTRIQKFSMEFHDNVSKLKHYDIQKLLEACGFETNLVWDGLSPFGYMYAKRR